jgi:hypothetical protein
MTRELSGVGGLTSLRQKSANVLETPPTLGAFSAGILSLRTPPTQSHDVSPPMVSGLPKNNLDY